MHRGDLLLLVTLLPIRFRCPLTWFDRPVLVSNQPQHRGHVCPPCVSGLTAVAQIQKIDTMNEMKEQDHY